MLVNSVRNAATVQVNVDGTTVATGRIVDTETGISRDRGTYVNVSGTGVLGPATSASMPLGHAVGGLTIKGAIEKALEPWDVPVVGSNATNRSASTTRTIVIPNDTTSTTNAGQLTYVAADGGGAASIQGIGGEDAETAAAVPRTRVVHDDRKVRARPGETVADWLRRFTAQASLLCWETARGEVFVGLPRYNMPALFTIVVPETPVTDEAVEGQVVQSKLVERPGDSATIITVTGRVGRGGESKVSALAMDTQLVSAGWVSPRIVTDDQLRDVAKAQAKADQQLRASQLEAYVYTVKIAGHGVGRYLPAIDTMINVRDAVCQVYETLWCAARSFTYSRDNGAEVELTLVKPNLWVDSES